MNERIEAVVSGRVQGVMYRDFSQRKARGLKLTGEVQNQYDGRVLVIAEGTREALTEYLERLQHGPLLADVKDIQVTWKPATNEYKKFAITYV